MTNHGGAEGTGGSGTSRGGRGCVLVIGPEALRERVQALVEAGGWTTRGSEADAAAASVRTAPETSVVMLHAPPACDARQVLAQMQRASSTDSTGTAAAIVVVLPSSPAPDDELYEALFASGTVEVVDETEFTAAQAAHILRRAMGRAKAASRLRGQSSAEAATGKPLAEPLQDLLAKTGADLGALIEALPIGVGFTDLGGHTLSLNRAALELHGFESLEQMLIHLEQYGQQFALRDADGRPMQLEDWPLPRAVRGETVNRMEVRLQRVGHPERRVLYTIAPLRAADGKAVALLAVMYDVTERRHAEELARQTELRYSTLFESVDEGFCVIEMLFDERGVAHDYVFIEANPAFERHTGLRDAVGRHVSELVPDLDESWFRIYGNVALTGEQTKFVNHAPAMNRWFEVSAFPVGPREQRRVGLLFMDITQRRHVEDELQRSQRQLASLFDTNLLGILFWRMDGAVYDANDEFLRIVGYDRSDLQAGRIDWVEMTPPEYRAADAVAVEQLRTRGQHDAIEKQYVRKDGQRAWVLVGSAVIEGDHGVGFVLDISASKVAEEALRQSEARAQEAAAVAEADRGLLNAILSAAPVGIVVADANGRIMRTNPANERLWGPTPDAETTADYVVWKGWWADGAEHHGQPVAIHEWALARALRGEASPGDMVEIQPFDQPEGHRRTMINSGAPVRNAAGDVVGGVIAQMDITRYVAAEAARRESEERFRALADNMSQLAWMTDQRGLVVWYNKRWYEYTGTTPEQMSTRGWQSLHHPDHIGRVQEKFWRHIRTGETWEDTFPLRSGRGEYRWFLSRAVPIHDADGHVVRWFGTNTDITTQRDAEEALRDADRRKDEFLATLAHELRNPLAPLRAAAYILKKSGQKDPTRGRIHDVHDVIDRQVTHMARLVDDLLDVARITRGHLELRRQECDLTAVTRQTVDDYRPAVDLAGLSLALKVPEHPVVVLGDETRLVQMLSNLLHNATRFTDRGGDVTVSLTVDERAQQVRLAVADTGVGMTPELITRLFDPFSQADQGLARTKGGLGLGLALTRGLTALHGGTLVATSPGLGRGSTFELSLPLAKQVLATGEVPIIAQQGLRLVLIEDNQDAAELLAELLQMSGHEVKIAFDGRTGIETVREFQPDAIISDIGLPGSIDGYAVARALRADPVVGSTLMIALSGYAQEEDRRKSQQAGFDAHMAKPPDVEKLESLLARNARRRPRAQA